MIEILNTVVTHRAVWAPRGSVETAGGAPLHPHLNAPNLHGLIEGSPKIILFILVLLSSGKDARIHKGGHTEVGQNKHKHNAIVYWHSNRKLLRKPRAREAEEERGWANQEGRCRRDWHVATRPERSGWDGGMGWGSGSRDAPTHTAARHHPGGRMEIYPWGNAFVLSGQHKPKKD